MKRLFTKITTACLLFALSMAAGNAQALQNQKQRNNATPENTTRQKRTAQPASPSSGFTTAADYTFTEITLPYAADDLPFDATNTVDVGGYYAILYKFTITEPSVVTINEAVFDDGYEMYSTLYSDAALSNIIAGDYNFSAYLLPGTYYLTVDEDDNLFNSDSYSLDISIAASDIDLVPYTELDYTTKMTTGKTYSGSLSDDQAKTVSPRITTPGAGYTFTAEAGKTYYFSYTIYQEQQNDFYAYITLLTGGQLQGEAYDYNGDQLTANEVSSSKNSYTFLTNFTATATEDIRILLQAGFTGNIIYTLEVTEIVPFAFTPVSIPYHNDEVVFSPGTTYEMGGQREAKGFSFTLAEESTVYFRGYNNLVGWGPSLYIYTDEEMQHPVVTNEWLNGYSTTLPAGNYYILVADDGYSGIYSCYLDIALADTKTGITVAQLLSDPDIQLIPYSETLSVADAGIFRDDSKLVAGDGTFRDANYFYYAQAYKITLPEAGNIQIHLSHQHDAYLCLYKADGSGGYTYVGENDDAPPGMYEGYDSYINYTVPAGGAGDYYIITTSFYAEMYGAFYLNVWNTATEPDKSALTVVSATASQPNLQLPENASEADIRFLLFALELNGKTANGATVPLTNSLFRWTIAADGKSASFVPYDSEYYTLADGVTVTVTFGAETVDIPTTPATPQTIVYTQPGAIIVANAPVGSTLALYTINGIMLANKTIQSETQTLSIPASGIYILRAGTQTFKVAAYK